MNETNEMNEMNSDSIKVEEPEMEKKENEEGCSIKRRMKEDRPKKKDDKRSLEQYSRILSHASNTEDKLDMMCKKYSQVVDENRRLSLALKHSEKKVELLLREREQLQIERSKGIMTRKRLENLCRELQKQNKIVKNESLQRVKEQEEIRKDLSEKFQGGLAQITTLMNQNIEKNAKMYEENLEINKKFKAVYEQVEQKEQQLLKVHQQMKLDLQLADAKLAKVKMEATAEKETLLKEKQQLLLKMTEYQAQIKELQATEVGLRSEINMYTDKYDEFQNALNRSNKIYDEFNVEMEKMTKKIFLLEKETSMWKQRWANSNDTLLGMAADKQIRDGEIATLNKKLALLQDLCKMFQNERTKLLAQLKAQNNNAPSSEPSTASAESEEVVKYMKKMNEMRVAFEQLQVQALTDISETVQIDPDANSKTAITITNDVAMTNQKSEATKTELGKENAEQLQTAFENVTRDSGKKCNSSKSKKKATKSLCQIDCVALDDMIEVQKIKNNTQELSDKSGIIITEIVDEAISELKSSKSEKVSKDSHELIKLSKTEEINEEANEVAKSQGDIRADDKSIIVEVQTNVEDKVQTNVKEMGEQIEVKEQNEILEQKSVLSGHQPEILNNPENILHAIDLIEKEKVDLSQKNVNNCVNEELKCQNIENENDNRRTCKNSTNGTVKENKSTGIACTNSSMLHDRTSLEDLVQNNPAEIVETNTEIVAEITDNCKTEMESTSAIVRSTFEVSDIINKANKDTIVINKDTFNIMTKTDDEIVKNNSELVENVIDLTENITLASSEGISELTAEDTCVSITENVTSLKEVPAKTALSLESDCAEEKLHKPAPIKNRMGKRRKK